MDNKPSQEEIVADMRRLLDEDDKQTALRDKLGDERLIGEKAARLGVVIFCIVHFIIEISFSQYRYILFSVIVNYSISNWYVKRQVHVGKIKINREFSFGFRVALIVFMIRVMLGELILP
jgi:hypothetical protein